MTLLKGQLEAAKKAISDFKKANHILTHDVFKADQEIQELRGKYAHLQKDMDGTLLAYEDMKETAKENQAACQVLRDQLEDANRQIRDLRAAVQYWVNQFNTADNKLQEIKKVLK